MKPLSDTGRKEECCPEQPAVLQSFPMAPSGSSGSCCPPGPGSGADSSSCCPSPGDDDGQPCCGPKPGPPSSPFERPGYTLCAFVDDFEHTSLEPVPRVKTSLEMADYFGGLRARLGVARDQYRVAPGLYCLGTPGKESPVLVTANYKLSFDHLRNQLEGIDAWLLVLDTRGVNVWCAAGKKTFCTDEIIRQVKLVRLAELVNHRTLILPQLGAPGVSAHLVSKGCGFKVSWGPIRAEDIRAYLANNRLAEPEMRRLTFTLWERLVLVPVEISLILKPSLWLIAALFLLSGLNQEIFSLGQAWSRGLIAATAYGLGVLGGAVLAPVLLPWLPGRSFYIKGVVTGLLTGVGAVFVWHGTLTLLEGLALPLISVAVSSYAAMNFTGATPYTSPSGVEKEMRRGIPLQILACLAALAAWVGSPFFPL